MQQALTSSLDVEIIAGNHDMTSSLAGDNALMPLSKVGNVTIIEKPCIELPVALVPFDPRPTAEWFEEAVAKAAGDGGDASVLAFHAGIIDNSTAPWLQNALGAVQLDLVRRLMDKHNFNAAFAGDWHLRKVWPGNIMQVGALVATGWDNPGLTGYGTLAIWDGKSITWEELPGARFVKVRDGAAGKKAIAEAEALGHTLYLQCVGNGAGELEDVEGVTIEHVPDEGDELLSARMAASAAQGADTMAEALAGFVNEMHLEDGVNRDAVHERCRGYLL